MKIIVNDIALNLEENDRVEVHCYECELCGSHCRITVTRGGEEIASTGDDPRREGTDLQHIIIGWEF